MPFRDVGLQVGKRPVDFIGTKAGQRFSLCIERGEESRGRMSDASVVTDIYDEIQNCLTVLRRADLMKAIRAHSLQQCALYLRELISKGTLDITQLRALIIDVVTRNLVGVDVSIGIPHSDFASMPYITSESSIGMTRTEYCQNSFERTLIG
jgi:hypothetical protein